VCYPFLAEARIRENIYMRDGLGLHNQLSCLEVPPKVRICDRLERGDKDQDEHDENKQRSGRGNHVTRDIILERTGTLRFLRC
jgi:hypothetical protein